MESDEHLLDFFVVFFFLNSWLNLFQEWFCVHRILRVVNNCALQNGNI